MDAKATELRVPAAAPSWLTWLDHNDNHAVHLRTQRWTARLCTRCLGLLLGVAFAIPVTVALEPFSWPGWLAVCVGLLLAGPDYLYWAATRLGFVADLNPLRVALAACLALGIVTLSLADAPLATRTLLGGSVLAVAAASGPLVARRQRADSAAPVANL